MIKTTPFFILANPRSGSSLLRIICESHSQLCVPPESGFMEWWYEKYQTWQTSDSLNKEKVNVFVKDIMSSRKFETWNLNAQELIEVIQRDLPKNYAELIASIYISFGRKNNKSLKVWGDKNNYYIHKTKLLNKLYPNAKYIHLIRDGRDVAASYITLKDLRSESNYIPRLTNNITEIAKEWSYNNLVLSSFFKTIDKKKVIRINFEDIINNINEECRRITDFLEVPFEETMLSYYILNKVQQIEPKETLDWKKKTLEEPDPNVIGKYKLMLSDEEIAIFNNVAQEGLIKFGYEV